MKRNMKTVVNTLLVVLALVTMLSVTAMVSAQKDAEEATETAKTSIDYALPYPGILPGHPLYPVKMLRDRVMSWFITDPLKKAEFYLLLADKRFNAGQFLVNYGKQSLGEQTISKGEKYFEQAIEMVKTAKKEGKDISPLVDRMEKAALKHEEILIQILKNGPSDIRTGIDSTLKTVKSLQLKVANLNKK